ncbi:hypothetical protein [Anditalea andensis]|uniref:Uncharacterized protein n=1 Tax=Anditalea andensis TaxID=1048983 RepID=A0A074L320_9BACT|nr:hypothetical protein [Anditalea andensis]KEO75574.1 hypothetical protein EL17_00330 [Anditalea andensis]
MFESPNFPKSLDEPQFEKWLEAGRNSKIPYSYLMVIWDELDAQYLPQYAESRDEIDNYPPYGTSPQHQTLVAAYDLHSEGRIK